MIYVDSLQDFRIPLKELKAIVDLLIEEHGEDTVIYTDGGYNVSICLDG